MPELAQDQDLSPLKSSGDMRQLSYKGGSKVDEPYDMWDWLGDRRPFRAKLACPLRNQVVVRIHGRADGIVRKIGAYCVQVDEFGGWVGAPFKVDGVVNYYDFSTGKWSKDQRAYDRTARQYIETFGQNTGSEFDRKCASGRAMVGFRGRAGWSLDRLQLECIRLGDNLGARTGANIETLSSVGGTGGSYFGSSRCGDHEIVRAIKVAFRHRVSRDWEPDARITRPARVKIYCGRFAALPELTWARAWLFPDDNDFCVELNARMPNSPATVGGTDGSAHLVVEADFPGDEVVSSRWIGQLFVTADGQAVFSSCATLPAGWQDTDRVRILKIGLSVLTDDGDRFFVSTLAPAVHFMPGDTYYTWGTPYWQP